MGGVMEADGLQVTECHLAKIYYSHGYKNKKPIYYLIGSAKLYRYGVFLQNITIDETGKFSYAGNTTGLSVAGEFYIPVWLDLDKMAAVMTGRDEEGRLIYNIPDLPLIERIYNFNGSEEIVVNTDPLSYPSKSLIFVGSLPIIDD
jgi:hypothetical protein